jgi:MFS family permease
VTFSIPSLEIVAGAQVSWLGNAHIPRPAAALMAALSVSEDSRQAGRAILRRLTHQEWEQVFDFTNTGGITLLAATLCREELAPELAGRIDRDISRNTERLRRLRSELDGISRRLAEDNIEFLLLKGFSIGPEYTLERRLRMHGDIDLFVPSSSVQRANASVISLGFEPSSNSKRLPADHLPSLTRMTGWRWRGDRFDPEIPPSVELHFRFWDTETERFPAPGVEEFWHRRVEQDGLPVLHPADRLAYATLHLLRHLFRGSARANHVYEIARFLDTQAENDSFWSTWRDLHPEPLRRLQAMAFRLAATWFGCRMASEPAEEVDRLPGDVLAWFEKYAASPVEALFHPNKHELWLHLAMLDRARDRRQILVRKIFPFTLPNFGGGCVPANEITFRIRWEHRIRHATYLASRTAHHVRALPVVLWHSLLWKCRASQLTMPFWWFMFGGALYAFGFFVFYLLYNLFLLDRGYREDALGLIASAATLGSVAGVLPAASFIRRIGLSSALKLATLAIPAAAALRCVLSGEPALIASAFVAAALGAFWAVAFSPTVAALTTEKSRPLGFSIISGSGIGVGALAGLIGGRVPNWVLAAHLVPDALHAKQLALLASVCFAALAFWPLSKLRLESAGPENVSSYPRSPFLYRFLAAMAVWGLATGAFNPLFNAYFEHRFRMPLERIGIIFTFSHLGQVTTILLAPLFLRKLGLVRGVACIQIVTGLALGSLAASRSAAAAAAVYVAYMGFQYMTEPGVHSLLMNHVEPARRSGAAALLFLVTLLAQAIAASASGAVVARYGYPPMLAGATVLAVVSAFLFRRLPAESSAAAGETILCENPS